MKTLKQTVLNVLTKKEGRKYDVSGSIIFMFLNPPSRECSDEVLRKLSDLITEVDNEHPWRDLNDLSKEVRESIKHIGKPYHQYNNWSIPELNVWIDVTPGAPCVRKSQLYAYEKYLETLAEEIAKRDSGATTVRSQFRVIGHSKDFET